MNKFQQLALTKPNEIVILKQRQVCEVWHKNFKSMYIKHVLLS